MTPLSPDEVARVFGQQLQQLRIAAAFTQGDLASACGISTAIIAKYERSARRPLPETVSLIGQVLEGHLPGAAARLALAWLVSAGGSAGADLDLLSVLLRWPDFDEATQQQVLEMAHKVGIMPADSATERRRVRPPKPPKSS